MKKYNPVLTSFMLLSIGFMSISLNGCNQSPSKNAQQTPPPPSVTVAKALQKEITEWDEFTGRFEPVETVDVHARVSGVIAKIHFKDGQLVKQGDLLMTIDQEPFKIAVEQARASVKEAKAGLELAINDVERAEPLVKKGNLPQSEFDARQSKKLQAQARLEAMDAALKKAELDLQWSEVKSPIAGRISDARIDVGNLITGGAANPTLLTRIVSLDPIHFVFYASEADFLKYSRLADSGERPSSRTTQNPVAVQLSDENIFRHEGKMDFVDNAIDPNSGTMKGRAIFENKSLFLTPGVFGRMRLFGGKSKSLLIPDAAISSDQARKIVFVADKEGMVKVKEIKLGPIVDGLRIVRSGLETEDDIIIAGIQRAKAGEKVTKENGKITEENNKK